KAVLRTQHWKLKIPNSGRDTNRKSRKPYIQSRFPIPNNVTLRYELSRSRRLHLRDSLTKPVVENRVRVRFDNSRFAPSNVFSWEDMRKGDCHA
ncbi:hypothetical protein BaRGS_00013976, partial [Batillaria attramentaria]